MGQAERLKQVLINLLDNALKFTPKAGSISVSVERSAKEVTLKVTDTGIGIPLDDQSHLFERFHRGRNASGYAGNGLGLAIVKAIVAAHRGTVDVRSEPGQGTSVSFTLPMHEAYLDQKS